MVAYRRPFQANHGDCVRAQPIDAAPPYLALPLIVVGFVAIFVYDGVSYGVDLAGAFAEWLES